MQPTTGGDAEEVFSEPEPNVIESSRGFSVRVLGRVGLEYAESGRTIWMDSEVLAIPRGIGIAPFSAKVWETPEGPNPLSDEDRARVAANIERAFRACDYEPEMRERFDWNSIAMRSPHERQVKRERYREEHGD